MDGNSNDAPSGTKGTIPDPVLNDLSYKAPNCRYCPRGYDTEKKTVWDNLLIHLKMCLTLAKNLTI